MREKSGKRVDDGTAADDETLDSSDDDSVDEELGFETPLDSADPYLAFKRALTGEPSAPRLIRITLLMLLFSIPSSQSCRIPKRHNLIGRGAANYHDGSNGTSWQG